MDKKQLLNKAKRKVANKATNSTRASNSNGGRSSRAGNSRGRSGSGKRGRGIVSTVLIFIVVLAIGFAANHFGLLDNVLDTSLSPSMPVEGELRVHFISVGQGDAILIHSGNNAVLIDSGPRSAEATIISYIQNLGIDTLDVVIGTHPHADHIGSKPGILDSFNIGEVWMPDVTHTTQTFDRFIYAIYRNDIEVSLTTAGDRLQAGQIQMTAVAPNSGGHDNLNDYSIVMHMQFGQTSFIFTADAELFTENEILEAGHNIRSNVMLVGHHGSRTSSSEAFLDAIGADIGVISVGEGNRYGHPHGVVLDRLNERNMEILRTDLLGSVVIASDGERVWQE